jgi:hypothetical protein
MEYAAPKGTIEVLQSAFWICAAVLCLAGVVRLFKGRPANESLGQSYEELKRRITHLEEENRKVWEKMERDRMEATERAAALGRELSALSSALKLFENHINFVRMKVEGIIK